MKEFNAAAANKVASSASAFRRMKKYFTYRLKEIARYGNRKAQFGLGQYKFETELVQWLRSLGYSVELDITKEEYSISW